MVWHLVGLLGPEQDEVDEVSMEEIAESVVLEEEAAFEEDEADLEEDGADAEEDDVEPEDDDVEQVEDELENHSGDSSSCSNHEGANKTLEVSITSQANI